MKPDTYRVNQEGWYVGVRHIPIVRGVLLAAKRVSFRLLFVEPACFLSDARATFNERNLPEHFAGYVQIMLSICGSELCYGRPY